MKILIVKQRKKPGKRGLLYDGWVNGKQVVSATTTPFCDAARVLMRDGTDSAEQFVMRREGQQVDALVSTVGVAAALAVRDGTHGPAFYKYEPYETTR